MNEARQGEHDHHKAGHAPQRRLAQCKCGAAREEIGSHLGLKLETVSRVFSKFQDDGMITVKQKHVQILEMERLRRLLSNGSRNLHE